MAKVELKFVEDMKLIKTLQKRKWFVISVALLGSIIFIFLLLPKFHAPKKTNHKTHLREKGHYFVPVKISGFSSADTPCLNIEIEGKSLIAKIDLGFSGGLSLPSEILKDLQNKLIFEVATYYGCRGKTYKSNVYELPLVRIGDMLLYRAKAKEISSDFEKDTVLVGKENDSSPENLGKIGWELFYNFNLLMDCKKSTLAFCDSLETLKNHGYPIEAFTEIPLLLDRNFIEFEAITDAGPLRCLLDTGATWNLLNKDFYKGSNEHMILNPNDIDEYVKMNPENKDLMVFNPDDIHETSCFKIGGKDFGTVKFRKIKSPLGIDAVIGMEFLEDKIVFIDFPERKIYFYERD